MRTADIHERQTRLFRYLIQCLFTSPPNPCLVWVSASHKKIRALSHFARSSTSKQRPKGRCGCDAVQPVQALPSDATNCKKSEHDSCLHSRTRTVLPTPPAGMEILAPGVGRDASARRLDTEEARKKKNAENSKCYEVTRHGRPDRIGDEKGHNRRGEVVGGCGMMEHTNKYSKERT